MSKLLHPPPNADEEDLEQFGSESYTGKKNYSSMLKLDIKDVDRCTDDKDGENDLESSKEEKPSSSMLASSVRLQLFHI